MKYIVTVLMCAFVCMSPACAENAPRSSAPTWQSESARTLDPALRVVADKLAGEVVASGRRAGMVVGIVDGKSRWVLGYGRKSMGSAAPPDGDTLYEIGSLTKTFTATALALMVKNGRIKLSDPVSEYLPTGTRVPSYKEKRITLQNLATHTSGLPAMPDDWEYADADPYAAFSPAHSYKFLARYKLPRSPGTKYEYSNFGAGLLGLALSRHNGSSYEKMVTDMICRPLKMNDTVITLSKDQRARLAPGYLLEEKSKVTKLSPTPNWTFQDNFAGAGALRSTANDMLTYIAANIGTEVTPLTEALDLTHKPRYRADDEGTSIGLGWHIATLPLPTGDTIICHAGGTGGYNSYAAFNKERKVGVVVLGNGTLADDTDEEESTAGTALLIVLMHPELRKLGSGTPGAE